jgi:hypothetical protein
MDISSYSVDELRKLLTQVQSRITELEKNNIQKCYVGVNDMSLGDGEGTLVTDVKNLQEFLREKGYFTAKSTGYFGRVTRAALVSYQAKANIPQTGEFDTQTREKIHNETCSKSVKSNTKEEVVKKEQVKVYTDKKEDVIKNEQVKIYSDKKDESTPTSKVSTITLSGTSAVVGWVPNGVSQYGYKIVWSKESNPSYPPRSVDSVEYSGEKYSGKVQIKAVSGSGAYYVRVCEYLNNGACGTYSNELSVQL